MPLPSNNGIFIHDGLNCSPAYIPTAQSIPISTTDSTTTKNVIDTTLSNIAEEFSTSSTYAVNDCVLYQRVLYQCTSAVTTAGAWDSSKWVAIKSVDAGLVKQVECAGSGYDYYELLFAGSTSNTTEINTVNKSSKLVYVPTSGYLELNGNFRANALSANGFSAYTSGDVGCIYLRGNGTKDSVVMQATSDGGKICLSDDMGYPDNIVLTGDDGNINAISLNGVTIGSSPQFTDTTYSAGTGLSLSGTTFSVKTGFTTSGNDRAVQTDSNGNLYVTQKDDNTTYSAGTGLSLSGTTFSVKTGYTTSGNNRAVQADANGNLYVTQKDDNTTYTLGTKGTAIRLFANGTAQNDIVAPAVVGTYTGSGGKQGPDYYGQNRVGFLMSNETVGNNGNYKNWLYMDNYNGTDVGGATAIGVDRTVPRAFIMQSDANRTSWNNKAELGVFTTTPVTGQILVSDGTSGGLKCSGYGTSSITDKLPLAGGTMTGTITLASTGLKTSAASGFTTDGSGNFKHQRTTNTDYWQLISNNGSVAFKYYWETGNLVVPGTITATTTDVSSSLSVSGNLQSVTKKLFKFGNVVELFMTGNVKTAIADNGVFMTVPTGYNPKVNDVGFTFFTGTDQYIPTGFKFGYFTWGGRDFHTLGALGVGTQVTVHITYLI